MKIYPLHESIRTVPPPSIYILPVAPLAAQRRVALVIRDYDA
jgi:hypothetical protein